MHDDFTAPPPHHISSLASVAISGIVRREGGMEGVREGGREGGDEGVREGESEGGSE